MRSHKHALCNAYSPVHIAHSLAPNVQCVCVVGCNSVHWAHCTVYIRQYPLRSVDYRVRVRSEMGSHQFRGSSHDPRLLNRHPLLSDHSDPQDQLDSPDRLQKLHNFTFPMDNQKLPLCNQGLQLISPLLTHKLAFVCIGAGLRYQSTWGICPHSLLSGGTGGI